MKKLICLMLTLTLMLSLAACGGRQPQTGDVTALDLLKNVWSSYSDSDKFPVIGGDYNSPVEDAPGACDVSKAEDLDSMLGIPAASVTQIDEAAALTHMMNANTFTAAACHRKSDTDAAVFAKALRDNLMDRQWICGFPEKLMIYTVGSCTVSAFGAAELLDVFAARLTACYGDAKLVYEENIL